MDPSDCSLTEGSMPVFDADSLAHPVVSREEAVREIRANSAQPIAGRPLHRIAEVRRQQNVSLTRAAKKLGVDISEARQQEKETSDLRLSLLYQWRELLQVPVAELVIEPDEIPCNPIKNRSQLIKMMKTARTITENSKEENIVILGRQLIDLLLELMPELKSITAWPSVGQSREQRDLGQAAYRRFDSSVSRRLDE